MSPQESESRKNPEEYPALTAAGNWQFGAREALLIILVIAAGLIISRDLLHPGIILSGDNVSHQSEIKALSNIILAEQHWWSGWYEGDFAGYPLLVYQYPLGKFIAVILGFLPGLEPGLIYKILLFLSWIFPVLVINRMLGKRGASILSRLAVSLLYLTCFDTLLFSMAGMWNQFLSAGLYLIALESIIKMMKSGTSRQVVKASLWTALAAVSHQFMILLFPITWLVLFLLSLVQFRQTTGSLKRLLVLPVLSFALSAWYFVPIFLTRDWPVFIVHPMKWYNLCSSLFPIVSSDLLRDEGIPACLNPLILLYSLGFLAALLAGIPGLIKVYSAIIKEKEVNLLFIAAAGILESVIILILLVLWEPIPFFRIFTFSVGGGRLALYLLLPLMLLSALFLESLAGRYGKKGQIPAAALIILLLPNFLWAATSEGFPLSEIALTGEFSQQATEPLKDLDTVFTWLEKNSDPSEGRILYQDTAYNINHPDLRWSHLMARGYERTGLWALGTVGQLFFPTDPLTRTQGFSIFGKLRHEISPDELEENMRLFNCRWALTCEPELEALFGSCRGMERVLSQGEFALFQAREPGSWVDIREGEGRVKTLLLQHHRRRFQAEISSPEGAVLLVKSSYHPWWNVELSGNRINPERGVPDQLLRIRVPEPGTYDIELEFRPARGLALLVTALGIIAAVILLLMERKKSMHGSRLDPLGKSHN